MPSIRDALNTLRDTYAAFSTPHEERTLKQRLTLTSAYSLIEYATRIFLRVISTIILSRLLEPSVFGVFAVIGMVMMMIGTFTDTGLRPIALSREGGLTHEFLQSSQTVRIIRGILLVLIMLVICLVVYHLQQRNHFLPDSAFADPELPYLMAGISLSFICSSLGTPNQLLYDRKLNHDLMFRFSMCFSVINGVLPFMMVYVTGSIWGLVIASVGVAAVRAGLSWVFFKGAPFGLRFDREHLLLFLHRGKWVMSQTMLTTLGSTADRVLFGLMFTDAWFGLYYLATQISQIFEQLLRGFEQKVGIQLFNNLADETPEKFREKYYRLRLPYDFVSLTTAGFLATIAPALIDLIYEARYSEVADFIQILAFASIFTGPCLIRQAFMSNREFKLTSAFTFVRVAFFWASLSIAILVLESVTVAMWMVVMQRLPEAILLLHHGHKRGWVSYWREVRMAPCLLLGAALGYLGGEAYEWLLSPYFS